MSVERGSVTITTAGVLVVLLVCTMGIADVSRVLAERSHAEMAADAAALAAAQDLAFAEGDPASDASGFAARNGAELVSCVCTSGSFEAVVEVRRPVGRLLLFPGDLSVTARARAVVDTP